MSNSFDTSQVRQVIDLQLLATLLALTTRDLESQDEVITETLREISAAADRALTTTALSMNLSDSLRNEMFAECADYIAQIKGAALGVARNIRD